MLLNRGNGHGKIRNWLEYETKQLPCIRDKIVQERVMPLQLQLCNGDCNFLVNS